MSIRAKAAIAGIAETPTDRLGSKPGEPRKSTAEYIAWAARLAMEDAGLTKKDFDGQGLAAIYTTNHPQPFWPEEVAAILGIAPGVSLAGGNGGVAPFPCLAARVAVGALETIMSTLRRTSSAARAGSRSVLPSQNRHSMMMFFPSTYPSSRKRRRNASMRAAVTEGEATLRCPIRGTFFGCCASGQPHPPREHHKDCKTPHPF